MEIANLIPEYLLREPVLLSVYCYLLRNVRPETQKIIFAGSIIALKPYEVFDSIAHISTILSLEEKRIDEALARLAELSLLSVRPEGYGVRIKFLRLVLPFRDNGPSLSEPRVYSDCWFEEFEFDYLEYVGTNLSPKTYDNAARVMKLFGEFIGRKKLAELKPDDLEEYKKWRKGKVMDSTVNIDMRTLKAALQVAVDWGRIESNPFRQVRQIRGTRKLIRPLTKEEFVRLYDKIEEPWLKDIIVFAVLTGLRRGEIMNLQWKDVDLERKTITIQSSEEYRVKHGKVRVLPLSNEAHSILTRQQGGGQWVFVNGCGERLKDEFVSKKFKHYARVAELPEEIHFHSLRATCASWGLKDGIPIYAVRNLLGHASVKTTEVYASYDQESLRLEVEKISLPEDLRC